MSYSEITPYIKELASLSDISNHIVPDMYTKHDVKRGLRDIDGNGVVAGLTEVSCIKAKTKDAEGKIFLAKDSFITEALMFVTL